MFSLGGPHQGAPLEKLGHVLTEVLGAFSHPGAAIPAEILKRRSEGVRDLREGVDVPLRDHIAHYFLATTMTEDPDHPLGQLFGDVMVRVPSASGPGESHAKLEIAPGVKVTILRSSIAGLDAEETPKTKDEPALAEKK